MMAYYDATDMATGEWKCCVKAENEEEAKKRASEKSGVAENFLKVEKREEDE